MRILWTLPLALTLHGSISLAKESDAPRLTACIIRHLGLPPSGGFPRLCEPTITRHLDDFVPVCRTRNFEDCLEAVTETATIISPVCQRNMSYTKRALLYCVL